MDKKVYRQCVYLANLDGIGSEQQGLKIVICVSNNAHNLNAPTFTCVPLTSKTKNELPVHYKLDTSKYNFLWKEDTTVLCESLCVIDKSRVQRFIGRIDDDDMLEIERRLMIQLGILD